MNYPKVVSVVPLQNYFVRITYETGETKLFDVKPYIKGAWFGKLKEPKTFQTVHPCVSTIEWKDGQDIAPHELYDLSI